MQTASTVTDHEVTEEKRKRKPKPTCNPDVGDVCCPFCGGTAPVRKNANMKMYYNCSTCGIVQPMLQHFQGWLMEHATIYGPEGKPAAVAPANQPAPEKNDAPKNEKNGGAEVPGGGEIAPPAASRAPVSSAKPEQRRGLRLFK